MESMAARFFPIRSAGCGVKSRRRAAPSLPRIRGLHVPGAERQNLDRAALAQQFYAEPFEASVKNPEQY